MDGQYTKIILGAAMLGTFVALLTTVSHFLGPVESVPNPTSHPSGVHFAENAVKYLSEHFVESDLPNLAVKFQDKLLGARNDRKRECGSIISVSAIDCYLCEAFVDAVSALVQKGSTRDDVAKYATDACVTFKIEDDRVCKAVIQEFKGELFGVLQRLAYSPIEVCSYALGTDCGEPYNPNAMWNITLPNVPKPPITPPVLPKPGSSTMRILHLTDFHMDDKYTAGSNANCGEPLCCRANDGPPAHGDTGAGKYGDFRNCDTAPVTADNLFKHLNSIQDQFDYVIFTGDIPAHNIWNQSRSDQVSAMNTFIKYMQQYLPHKMFDYVIFTGDIPAHNVWNQTRQDQTMAMNRFNKYLEHYLPNKKVFSSLGNHESAPVDSFPPPYVTGNDSESWLYKVAAENWLNWLPSETEATIKKAGFYSTKPFPGLRIISLNMNMCNNGNWWLFINTTDPAGMLEWFISELQDAETAGDKVHVLGHIFPGCNCCLKAWSWNYYKIVNRYEDTIAEQFFGHTHEMYYEMFYDEVTFLRPLSVAYMPGSITTYSDLNPGFRIYEIDGNYAGSSWKVQDFTNYFLNLTHANIYGELTWEKEYSAKEAYGMPSLFPKDWNDLIFRMKTDDELFQKFCTHRKKSAPNTCATCTGECRKNFLCDLKSGRSGDPNLCNGL